MKYLMWITFLLCTNLSYSQDSLTRNKLPAYYYIDSIRVLIPIFDVANIDSVYVANEYDIENRYGKIYITTKNPRSHQFLTLGQIARQNISNLNYCLFMINDELIKDTSYIRVDSSYILKCEIVNTKELKYLQAMPSLNILNIYTKTKENIDKANRIKNQIHLRGTESILP